MRNEQEIRRLMKSGLDAGDEPSRSLTAVSRARRQVGQRDTLAFALVRIWAVLAKLLAPLFAFLGERQAEAQWRTGGAGRKNTNNVTGENHD
jgi:hypothetical protein